MLRKSKEKWYNMELERLRCSRCGCVISEHDYIQTATFLIIIGTAGVMHFCNRCKILHNGDE